VSQRPCTRAVSFCRKVEAARQPRMPDPDFEKLAAAIIHPPNYESPEQRSLRLTRLVLEARRARDLEDRDL
jgi:hypothetical protein